MDGSVGQGIRPFLVTDLYEVTMVASYLRRGMVAPATFSLFVRRLPPSRGFLVAAGIDEAVDRLAAFEVTDRDEAVAIAIAHGSGLIDLRLCSVGIQPEVTASR